MSSTPLPEGACLSDADCTKCQPVDSCDGLAVCKEDFCQLEPGSVTVCAAPDACHGAVCEAGECDYPPIAGACGDGGQCVDGVCMEPCTPDCGGKQCGPDGCGGGCGSCAVPADGGSVMCLDGHCVAGVPGCAAHGGPGCGAAECPCEEGTLAERPSCADSWDTTCATICAGWLAASGADPQLGCGELPCGDGVCGEGESLCACPEDCPPPGCKASPFAGCPGCNGWINLCSGTSVTFCDEEEVCAIRPSCCTVAWDEECAARCAMSSPCAGAPECNDGTSCGDYDPCTLDSCESFACVHAPTAGCCTEDEAGQWCVGQKLAPPMTCDVGTCEAKTVPWFELGPTMTVANGSAGGAFVPYQYGAPLRFEALAAAGEPTLVTGTATSGGICLHAGSERSLSLRLVVSTDSLPEVTWVGGVAPVTLWPAPGVSAAPGETVDVSVPLPDTLASPGRVRIEYSAAAPSSGDGSPVTLLAIDQIEVVETCPPPLCSDDVCSTFFAAQCVAECSPGLPGCVGGLDDAGAWKGAGCPGCACEDPVCNQDFAFKDSTGACKVLSRDMQCCFIEWDATCACHCRLLCELGLGPFAGDAADCEGLCGPLAGGCSPKDFLNDPDPDDQPAGCQ